MISDRIAGWFNFADIYDSALNLYEEGIFVEVGTFMGKSAAYMAEMIEIKKRNIDFYTIDHFQGSKSELEGKHQFYKTINIFERATKNLKDLPVTLIKGNSTEVANTFKDGTVSLIFLDGSHEYEDIKADLNAWYPKLTDNGTLAGHDYTDHEGVYKAVNEFAIQNNLTIEVTGTSFILL